MTAASAEQLARTATLPGRGTPAPSGIVLGQQLGHYRIDRKLGAGGMGEVYLATDLALDRHVAVKVLPDDVSRDATRRARLIREARAQARISHSNVAHIYFVGEEAGRLFFAMEYVTGQTLADRIAAGPVRVDQALEWIRAAALGLREAQRQGITHRDIKPSNLMLDAHGVLKILDFGLAAGAPGAVIEGPVAQTSLAGTPLYMAPEQARGEAIDARADIYALGATLYHLISGKPPFAAESAEELVSLHATAARPPVPRRGQVRTQIGAIDELCARMMATRVEDRFASYDELLRALELASTARTQPAGFWVRAMASGVDFMVVVALYYVIGGLLLLGGINLDDNGNLLFPVLGMYQILAVSRWGRTAGKALFELEVVDVETSQRPPLARVVRRTLAMLGVPVALGWAGRALDAVGEPAIGNIVEGGAIASIPVLVALLLYASARNTSKRAVWDRASSTLVRYRRSTSM
ncbi:MAG: protein kinase [Kofleriaceae bacterium]|nr:protein kinase [Kofleriaceae bacterium]